MSRGSPARWATERSWGLAKTVVASANTAVSGSKRCDRWPARAGAQSCSISRLSSRPARISRSMGPSRHSAGVERRPLG